MKKFYGILEQKWQLHILIGIFSLAAATFIGIFFRDAGFPDTNVVLLYILAVLITSCLTKGYFFGLLVSVAATLVFNYFFTKPYFSLDVYDPSYLFTFMTMTIAALVTSTLTSRVKQNALEARDRETETQALYRLTSHLTEAKDADQVVTIVVKAIRDRMGCHAACLCFDDDGKSEETSFDHAENVREWPIRGENQVVGVIMIPQEEAGGMKDAQEKFLSSLIECTALAMDRIVSAKQQMLFKQETVQERYRGNLLRAISHDLRTPLSGIMGTAEMLMDMSEKEDPRYELAQGILKDTQWLHSLVENILSLTRIQEGPIQIHKEYEAAEEIVGGAVARISGVAPEYEISVKVPEDVLMVPMDGKLIMQVLINLLDNAVKHCQPEEEISVTVEKVLGDAVFKVSDSGEGIAAEDLPNLFQTFYTSQIKSADSKKGIGLGLSICESIVTAHGGTMGAQNRADGPGAEFMFTLPLHAAGMAEVTEMAETEPVPEVIEDEPVS